MNKDLIKKRFSKSLEHYNDNAKIQKQMAEKLLSMLENNTFNSILEIGCGTGLLTRLAVERLNYDSYLANDLVQECESYIKDINNTIEFKSGDIETLVKQSSHKFDLIISNAAFQWVENLYDFIKILIQKLNPNGVLLFSIFGMENYREIYHVTGKSLNYYSCSELSEMLKEWNYMFDEEIRVISFKTPVDVLRHLKYTGVNALSSEKWTKSDLQRFINGYNNFCSNRPTLTYNPIYIAVRNNVKN